MLNKLNLDENLIISEYKNGKNTKELSQKFKCGQTTINRILKKNNVVLRKSYDYAVKLPIGIVVSRYLAGDSLDDICKDYKCCASRVSRLLKENNVNVTKECTTKTELNILQKQILDGCLLGDSEVSRPKVTAKFSTPSINLDFLENLQELLPFTFSPIYKTEARKQIICGKLCNCKDCYELTSWCDKSLDYYRDLWYPQGIKIVPRNLELSPITVLYWWYGDGYSSFKKDRTGVTIGFCTNGFTVDDCEFLVYKLKEVNLDFHIAASSKNQPMLVSYKRQDVFDFFDYIGKCTVPSFQYKWKFPGPNKILENNKIRNKNQLLALKMRQRKMTIIQISNELKLSTTTVKNYIKYAQSQLIVL